MYGNLNDKVASTSPHDEKQPQAWVKATHNYLTSWCYEMGVWLGWVEKFQRQQMSRLSAAAVT